MRVVRNYCGNDYRSSIQIFASQIQFPVVAAIIAQYLILCWGYKVRLRPLQILLLIAANVLAFSAILTILLPPGNDNPRPILACLYLFLFQWPVIAYSFRQGWLNALLASLLVSLVPLTLGIHGKGAFEIARLSPPSWNHLLFYAFRADVIIFFVQMLVLRYCCRMKLSALPVLAVVLATFTSFSLQELMMGTDYRWTPTTILPFNLDPDDFSY